MLITLFIPPMQFSYLRQSLNQKHNACRSLKATHNWYFLLVVIQRIYFGLIKTKDYGHNIFLRVSAGRNNADVNKICEKVGPKNHIFVMFKNRCTCISNFIGSNTTPSGIINSPETLR